MSSLDVRLRDVAVGSLTQPEPGAGYSFAYDAALVAAGKDPKLSVSLPCQADPFGPADASPFFEGLLPEGPAREQIARDFKVSTANSFELLTRLGRDCAGAVVLLPPGERPDADEPIEWLAGDELARLIERLPRNPLGVTATGKLRLSLAGLQRKAVLVRRPDGVFGKPTATNPSTHILKPQYDDSPYEDLVCNERFCMAVAANAGLDAARTELVEIAGHPCLLVERFDRAQRDGQTARVHQEDACQALGFLPGVKYESEGGPGLAAIAELLRSVSARGGADVLALLRATILNFVLGNGDAHAKNFSLLHAETTRLAPLYDVVSTAVYPDVEDTLAMAIGDEVRPEAVDGGDLFELAEDCGLSYVELAREWTRFAAVVLRSAESVAAVALAEGWYRPVVDRIVAVARRRAGQIA